MVICCRLCRRPSCACGYPPLRSLPLRSLRLRPLRLRPLRLRVRDVWPVEHARARVSAHVLDDPPRVLPRHERVHAPREQLRPVALRRRPRAHARESVAHEARRAQPAHAARVPHRRVCEARLAGDVREACLVARGHRRARLVAPLRLSPALMRIRFKYFIFLPCKAKPTTVCS